MFADLLERMKANRSKSAKIKIIQEKTEKALKIKTEYGKILLMSDDD